MEQKRELRAIMFTDMKSFSRMMGQDENRTIRLVKEHRDLFRSLLPKYRGVEQSTSGDSFFVIFSSALEAVNCAIEIQQTLEQRNRELDATEQIWIRIGIHLGDVFYDESDKDVFGEAINIAARTEPLARTGGICITGPVYGQVKNKLAHGCQYGGKLKMKNITDVPDLYHVLLAAEAETPVNRKLNLLLAAAVVTIALLVGVWFQLRQVPSPTGLATLDGTPGDVVDPAVKPELPVEQPAVVAIPEETTKPAPLHLEPGDPLLSTRLLTEAELKSIATPMEAERLINGIFARQGMVFEDPEMRLYFQGKPWYKATLSPDDDVDVSTVEGKNQTLLEGRIREIAREALEAHPEHSGFPTTRILLHTDRRWPGLALATDVLKDLDEFTRSLATWLEDRLINECSVHTRVLEGPLEADGVTAAEATLVLSLRVGGLQGNHFRLRSAGDPTSEVLLAELNRALAVSLADRLTPLPPAVMTAEVKLAVPHVELVFGPATEDDIYELYEQDDIEELVNDGLRDGILSFLRQQNH